MKRILLFIFMCIFSMISCNTNVKNHSENHSGNHSENKYDSAFVEFAKQFNLLESIDTINLIHVDAKAFQILDKNMCLATEFSDGFYGGAYNGNNILVLTNELLFDNIIFKDNYILLGTYHYTSLDSMSRTVKAYSSKDFYIKHLDAFNAIIDINK